MPAPPASTVVAGVAFQRVVEVRARQVLDVARAIAFRIAARSDPRTRLTATPAADAA